MRNTVAVTAAAAWLLLAGIVVAQPAKALESLSINEQKSFTPGYAVGDIAIGNPKVADFKVMPGRRELLLFGRGEGQTTLTIWDQRRAKRHEIVISVHRATDPQLERELRALLHDFPSVEVRTLAGALVVAGTVSSKDDLAAIEKIAAAAGARSLVRYVPPATTAPVPAAGGTPVSLTTPAPPPTKPAPSPTTPPPPVSPTAPPTVSPPAPPATPPVAHNPPGAPAALVEYEIELLEASTQFRSGSYRLGIEPSGRRLYLGTVAAPIGAAGEIFIGGVSVAGAEKPKSGKAIEQGIRLTLRPQAPDPSGRFKTAVLVETNLPFESDVYDPATWRRARWEFTTVPEEPFAITGAELLAAPDLPPTPSANRGRTPSAVSRLPGVSSLPGTEFVPVFGSLFGSSSYKQRKTQLLVIIRPRLVRREGD